MREKTRAFWRVKQRDHLRVVLGEIIRGMQRGSMRAIPHDQMRRALRFDGRVCLRAILRDCSQDDVRAEGRACARDGT